MKDPTFAKAKEVLETLSDDPDVQYWARRREEGEVLYRHELAMTHKAGVREGREEGKREGLDEGRREGLDEGRREGLASMLLDQLQERFGEVPDDLQERVRNAPIEALRSWGKRLVSATTLQEVFGAEE